MLTDPNELAISLVANIDGFVVGIRKAQDGLEKIGVTGVDAGKAIDRAFDKLGISADEAAAHISQAFGRSFASAEEALKATTAATERSAATQISIAEKVATARAAAADRAAVAEVLAQDRANAAIVESQGVRLSVIQAAMAKEKALFEERSALQSALAGRGTTLNPNQKLAFAESQAAAQAEVRAVAAQRIVAEKEANAAIRADMQAASKSFIVPGLGSHAEELKKAQARSYSSVVQSQPFQQTSKALAVGGAGVLAGLGYAGKVAAEFDQAMRNVNSIAQLPEPALAQLKKSILGIASDPQIRQGPRDLAKAMYEIASSGFTGQRALDVLKVSAKGASAGMTDTATSSKALMAVLNSGIKGFGGDAHKAMDILFREVDLGVNTFGQLATGIGRVLPSAKISGMSLQELGAALAVMTRHGLSFNEAVTSVASQLNHINRPSKDAQSLMKSLGIEYGVAAINAKGYTGWLQELIEKTHGNKQALVEIMPEFRGMKANLILADLGGRQYTDMLKGMMTASDGAGRTSAALNQQNKGATAQWDILKKNVEVFGITIGTTVLPQINALISRVTGLFQGFNTLNPSTQTALVRFVAWSGAIALGLGVMGRLLTWANSFKAALTGIGFLKAATDVEAVGAAGALATTRLSGLAGAISSIRVALVALAGGPIGVIGGIATAVGAATYGGLKLWQGKSEANIAANERPLDMGTVQGLRRATNPFRTDPRYKAFYNTPIGDMTDRVKMSEAEKDRARIGARKYFGTDNLSLLTPAQVDQLAGKISAASHALDNQRRGFGAVGAVPASLRAEMEKIGQVAGAQCGQAISNFLHSPGAATRIAASGKAASPVGRDAQGNPVYRQGTMAFWPGSRGRQQHFARTYLDEGGVERVIESTTAGGRGRHYRGDRTLAQVQREHGGSGRFYQVPEGGAASAARSAASGVDPSAARVAAVMAARAAGHQKLTEAQRQHKAGLKELVGLHAAAVTAITPHTAAEAQHVKIVADVARQYNTQSAAFRASIVAARESRAEQTKAANDLIADQKRKEAGLKSYHAALTKMQNEIRSLRPSVTPSGAAILGPPSPPKLPYAGINADQAGKFADTKKYLDSLKESHKAQHDFNDEMAKAQAELKALQGGGTLDVLAQKFRGLIPRASLEALQQLRLHIGALSTIMPKLAEMAAQTGEKMRLLSMPTATAQALEGLGIKTAEWNALTEAEQKNILTTYTAEQRFSKLTDTLKNAKDHLKELLADWKQNELAGAALAVGDKREAAWQTQLKDESFRFQYNRVTPEMQAEQKSRFLKGYDAQQAGPISSSVNDYIAEMQTKLADLRAGDRGPQLPKEILKGTPAEINRAKFALDAVTEQETTNKLTEALNHSQVQMDKAKGSVDFYAAALDRLKLTTTPLTSSQRDLVSQIANVDKQAAALAAHTRLMQNASRTIEGIFARSFDEMFKKGGNFFKSLGDGFKNLAQKIVVDWAASKVTGFLTPLLDKGLGLLGIGGKGKNVSGNTAAPIEQASLQAGGAITSGGAVLQRALLGVAAGIGGPRLALAGGPAGTLPGVGLNLGMGGGGGLFPGLTLPSLTQGYTPGFNPAVANPIDQAGKATAASIQTTGNAVSNSLFGLVGIFQQHGSHLSQVLSALAMVFSSMKGGTMGGLGSIFGGLSGLFSKGKGGGGLLGKIFGGASFVKGISSLFAPKKKKKHGLFGGILGGIGSIFGKLGGGIFGKLLTGIGGGFPGILMSLLGGGEDGPLGDFLPMFGNGGFPSVDMPSIVGEKGPELFIPQNKGRIISNSDLNLALQRGGNTSHSTLNAPITVTVHNTVHGGLHTQMDTKAMSDNLSEQILREVRSGLRKPQRF